MGLKVALVGSRNRDCRADVESVVAALPEGTVVVSGGAKGVDTWAVQAAQARGLLTLELRPKITSGMGRGLIVKAYLSRNTQIVRVADRVIAWPHPDDVKLNTGGTMDTIRKARAQGKPVEVR